MHYYIVDPPDRTQTARIAERLQELITPLGIAGEISVATPARTSEELAYMGLDKGYTTIIAVGGEDLANTVATILQNESREKVAFGIIPINAGPLIPEMVGVANNDLRSAVQIIKQRHLDLVDSIQIGTKRFVFTEAVIAAPRIVKMSFEMDQNFKAECLGDFVHISHDMVVTIRASEPQAGLLKKTLSVIGIGSAKQVHNQTQLHGHQMRVMAHEPLPILVAGQVVAKTPTTFTRIPAALKLITVRATLPSKTINDLNVASKEPSSSLPTDKETYSRSTNE